MIKYAAIMLLATMPSAIANPQWTRDPNGKWVYVDQNICKWETAPTNLHNWQCVYPNEDWRHDPSGRWQVIPK